MHFLYLPLVWGFLLVLVPLAIHLINVLRHRRIAWAAMDFLLQSYKKHRRWIWLKQFLLLMMRMLAVALLVAMLARLVSTAQWARRLGGPTTHHYLVLDDSYSMSDTRGGVSTFDRARQAVWQIVRHAGQQATGQHVTLLRYAQAARGPTPSDDQTARADLLNEPVTEALVQRLQQTGGGLDVTELATDATDALAWLEANFKSSVREDRVVYLISDFRRRQWRDPAEVRDRLGRLARQGAQIHLVRCAREQRPNLAIVELRPAEGTLAAGVPLLVNVKMKNFGDQAVQQVPVRLVARTYPHDARDLDARVTQAELPPLIVDRIAPHQIITRQTQVIFSISGQHVVQAVLPADCVAADNARSTVIEVPDASPVLLVDGDPVGKNAYYLESVFQPSTRTKTGIVPTVQPPTYLRNTPLEALTRFSAIYLLDVSQLDASARANLDQYVQSGGGLGIFLGPNVDLRFYRDWYGDGQGLFPAPVVGIEDVSETNDARPLLEVADHPVLRVLSAQGGALGRELIVERYVATPRQWKPAADSTVQILAHVNGVPIALERRFGTGRVMAFLTTLAPTWNNWATQPSFVVVALQLQVHLAAPQRPAPQRLVGSSLEAFVDPRIHQPQVTFVVPSEVAGQPITIRKNAAAAADGRDAEPSRRTVFLGRSATDGRRNGETDRSGIYEVQLAGLDGSIETRRYALNVDPDEGDLALMSAAELRQALQPVSVVVHEVDDLVYRAPGPKGFSWSQLLLTLLVILLMAEQLWAYSASYHPASRPAREDLRGGRGLAAPRVASGAETRNPKSEIRIKHRSAP